MQTDREISSKIGFMQGRLSPIYYGRIQTFPWMHWKEEIEIASKNQFEILEWTADTLTINKNPILNISSTSEILECLSKCNIEIPSLTCDYFMENPPWKKNSEEVYNLIAQILIGMSKLGTKLLIIPLVDNSSLKSSKDEKFVIEFFKKFEEQLMHLGIKISFEMDYEPNKLIHFISQFPHTIYGINYDIGNSASFGFLPELEFECYGARITNVHVKDRLYRGSTVPLGQGSADLPKVFKLLNQSNYSGNYILQTARAENNNHLEVMLKYRTATQNWIKTYD
jgi:L-ribulose-5-phosphate 3-epimerase